MEEDLLFRVQGEVVSSTQIFINISQLHKDHCEMPDSNPGLLTRQSVTGTSQMSQ